MDNRYFHHSFSFLDLISSSPDYYEIVSHGTDFIIFKDTARNVTFKVVFVLE